MRDKKIQERELIAQEIIESKIFFVRGKKVMLDKDLAKLYGVLTKRLKEQVKRNIDRFPEDFMIELDWDEIKILESRSQIATLKKGKNTKYKPLVFTEQGVAMLFTNFINIRFSPICAKKRPCFYLV